MLDFIQEKINIICDYQQKNPFLKFSRTNSLFKIYLVDFIIVLNNFYDKGLQRKIEFQAKENDIKNDINSLILKRISSSAFSNIRQKIAIFSYEIIFYKKISQFKDKKSISLNNQSIYKCYCYKNHKINCSAEIIRAHTISKTNNFKAGQKYSSFSTSIYDRYILNKLVFSDAGRDEASTAFIFCGDHDKNIFLPIEGDRNARLNIDLNDEEHYRLQNYRIYYKRELDDLESHLISIQTNQEIINLNDNVVIKLIEDKLITHDQRTLNELDTLEHKIFEPNLAHKTLYFTIELNNNVQYLISTFGDASYLDHKVKFGDSHLFFHILQNDNNPCLIFSAFDTDINRKVLFNLKNMYGSQPDIFWNLIASFSCINENIFFTETFLANKALANKFLIYANEDNQYVNNKDFMNRPFFKKKLELTSCEAQFLFDVKSTCSNF